MFAAYLETTPLKYLWFTCVFNWPGQCTPLYSDLLFLQWCKHNSERRRYLQANSWVTSVAKIQCLKLLMSFCTAANYKSNVPEWLSCKRLFSRSVCQYITKKYMPGISLGLDSKAAPHIPLASRTVMKTFKRYSERVC